MSTLEVNKITPQGTGTTVTLGDSGDSIDITSGATVTNFKSTGIDDNATSTAVTVSSSGQVIIGGTSAENSSVVLEAQGATNPIIQVEDTTNNIRCGIQAGNTDAVIRCPQDNDLAFVVGASEPERMRIQSNGRALFSTTGTNSIVNSAWKYQMRFDGASDAGLYFSAEANANGTGYLGFHRSTSTEIGSVTRNGTNDSVNYNTSSDYRMKENVIDLDDATTRVKQLQPKRFSWISQESDMATQDGFIAHEVQSIVPEAITGTKDEVEVWKEGEELPEGVSVGDNKLDDEGNTIPKYQGIDQSKLVPLLTASLQEAIAKIETLESTVSNLTARLEALENA